MYCVKSLIVQICPFSKSQSHFEEKKKKKSLGNPMKGAHAQNEVLSYCRKSWEVAVLGLRHYTSPTPNSIWSLTVFIELINSQ